MEIHLIRHTKTIVSDGICFGQSDVALRDCREDDLKNIQIDTHYDVVYSSPLRRCTQMAEFLHLDYKKDVRLCEINFGDWEMHKWEEVPKASIQPWYDDFIHISPPNGESVLTFQARVLDFFGELGCQYQDKKILIITHSGVIRLLAQHVLEFPLENMFRLQPQHGKRLIVRKTHGLWSCEGFNL